MSHWAGKIAYDIRYSEPIFVKEKQIRNLNFQDQSD